MTFCRAHGAAECLTCSPQPTRPAYMQGEQGILSKPTGRAMNKTEARYASLLEGMKLAGEIVSYAYEPIGLIIGPRCTYRCDFVVSNLMETTEVTAPLRWHFKNERCRALGCKPLDVEKLRGLVLVPNLVILEGLQFHEVKGRYTRDDALVKIKSASQQFPWFLFKLCRYIKGSWSIKDIK